MENNLLEEKPSKKECLLGIIVQHDLKWSSYVEYLCGKLKQRLAGLSKLRRIMCKSSKSMVIQGVFQSVLSYCLPLFGGCSQAELNSLQILQNGAALIALNLPIRSNREKMYDTLYWLTVRQLVAFHTLLTVYRVRRTGHPEYLANLLLNEKHRGKS